jgi:hypothetical protein
MIFGWLGFVRMPRQLSITRSRPLRRFQPGWVQLTGCERAHRSSIASGSFWLNAR